MASSEKLIEYVQTKWGSEPPSDIVAKIGKGDRLATEALAMSHDAAYRSKVVQTGAVDKLLEFLIKTDKPFRDVLPLTSEEQIPCPSVWVNCLNNFCQDGFLRPESLARDVQYKIIINMGPLFQDMSNMSKRELFGDRDAWIKSIMFFCNILFSLLSSNFDKIGDFLLKQKMLQEFLVRTLFLPMSEPDVASEIKLFSEKRDNRTPKPDIIGSASTFCACAIKAIWTKRGAKIPTLIEIWAGTQIRPEHELRLMTGILPLLLMKSHREGWYQGGYSATLTLFLIMYDKATRLSGPFGFDSVSEVLVWICRRHLMQFASLTRDRYFVENILTGIVTAAATMMTPPLGGKPGGKQAPIDYNVAKAIRAGLLEYFVDCCDANDPRIANTLEGSIRTISVCLILEETRKALEEIVPSIKARIERIQDRHPVLLPPLQNIKELLNNPLINTHQAEESCAFCQEKIEDMAKAHKCTFCKTIAYCSKDCHRLNWMIHQSDCASKRKDPVAQSTEKLMSDGKKFFPLHVTKLLLQASLKGLSILECIVVIDMCEYTCLLKTYTLEQFASIYIQDEEAIGICQRTLDRNKKAGALTVSFVGFSETEGFKGNLMTFPSDAAPLMTAVAEALPTEKWSAAQIEVARTSLGQAKAQLEKNLRLYQATLMKTMKP